MRLFLYLAYYALAMLLGFVLRQRYDRWMYGRAHMQQRLRLFALEVAADREAVGTTLYFPPSTTDNLALSPRATDAWLRGYAGQPDGAGAERSPSGGLRDDPRETPDPDAASGDADDVDDDLAALEGAEEAERAQRRSSAPIRPR